MALTLLLGGARSGKSTLAVDVGHRADDARRAVTFVATAPAVDDDMVQRIEHHRAERPAHWTTVEEQLDLAGAIGTAAPGLVIVDCLTLWTSNLLWHDHTDDEVRARAAEAADVAAGFDGDVVAISNEVGLGLHPDTALGRRYRDLHGWVNQRWARAARRSLLVVAGRALALDDPFTHLDHLFDQPSDHPVDDPFDHPVDRPPGASA